MKSSGVKIFLQSSVAGIFFLFTAAKCNNKSANNSATPDSTRSVQNFNDSTQWQEKPELEIYFKEQDLSGMFALREIGKSSGLIYNSAFFEHPISPASTFNILLTLIGLEEGVLKNEKTLLSRDTIRYRSSYPSDTMDLYEAFTNNRDWFFIRLASLLTDESIGTWMNKINYANKTIEGEKNRFWINGELKISPAEQLKFIEKLYREDLPFSKNNLSLVKRLMKQKASSLSTIYGKRGSNKPQKEKKYTGWFIGYVESRNLTYSVVNYVESFNLQHPTLVNAQKEIVYRILQKLKLH